MGILLYSKWYVYAEFILQYQENWNETEIWESSLNQFNATTPNKSTLKNPVKTCINKNGTNKINGRLQKWSQPIVDI